MAAASVEDVQEVISAEIHVDLDKLRDLSRHGMHNLDIRVHDRTSRRGKRWSMEISIGCHKERQMYGCARIGGDA